VPHVMLRKDRQGNFKRTVRPIDGGPSRRLEFTPGEVVEIADDEVPAILKDLQNKILLPVEWSEQHRKFVVIEISEDGLAAAEDDKPAEVAPVATPEETSSTEQTSSTASPEKVDGPQAGRRSRK